MPWGPDPKKRLVGPATSGSLKRPDSPRNLIVLLCTADLDLTDLLETACLVSRSIDVTGEVPPDSDHLTSNQEEITSVNS